MIYYIGCRTEDSHEKLFKKVLQKVLTKWRQCDIIVKSLARAAAQWSLKIEQQEMKVSTE